MPSKYDAANALDYASTVFDAVKRGEAVSLVVGVHGKNAPVAENTRRAVMELLDMIESDSERCYSLTVEVVPLEKISQP